MNEELLKAYRQGYRDGREDTKKEMNYQNYPPTYYGTSSVGGYGTVGATPMTGVPTGGMSYAVNGGFTVDDRTDNLYNGC